MAFSGIQPTNSGFLAKKRLFQDQAKKATSAETNTVTTLLSSHLQNADIKTNSA
jgi:hypothetical protein